MIVLNKSKVIYVPTPKVGCSSVKNILCNLNAISIKKYKNVHIKFPTKDYDNKILLPKYDDYYKFCVVRDPIDRFISGYNNRIVYLNDLKSSKNLNLKRKPNLNELAINIRKYCNTFDVFDHHFKPMINFIGPSPDTYSKIFNLKNIDTELVPILENIHNKKVKIKTRHQLTPKTTKGLQTRSDLTQESIELLMEFYKEDYEIYGSYF